MSVNLLRFKASCVSMTKSGVFMMKIKHSDQVDLILMIFLVLISD